MRRINTKESDVTSSAARGLTGTGSRNGVREDGLANNPDVKLLINRQNTEVIHEDNELASKMNSIDTPDPNL